MKIPQNLKKHFELIEELHIPLSSLFQVPDTPFKEKFLRKYAAPIVGKMPLKLRYLLTSTVKRMRNRSKKLVLHYPLDFPECQKIAEELKDSRLRPWWGKKGVVCVCHDVDNYEGYEFVPKLAKINLEAKLPATFNFLTHDDYSVDRDLIKNLTENQFEIGLHGYTHDQGFAFRGKQKIRSKITQALDKLSDTRIVGYRSPALSLSHHLFECLSEMKFLYDSSFQIASPFYHSVRIPYPVYLEKYQIWQLPLMVQDDNYLRDAKTSKEESFSSIRRFIREIISLNGVFVINMHPHLMVKNQSFYTQFIEVINEFKEEVAFRTTKDVILYAEGNSDHNQ